MPNETLLFRTRPHPIVAVGYLLLVLLFFAALLFISPPLPSWVVFVLPTLALAVFLLDYFSTIYEATTEAVVKRQGFPWLREELIPLREVQDLKFRTGILGRIFGFGTLEIESAGTEGRTVLHALPTWAYRILRPLRRNRSETNEPN